jgi:hypothetical protein
MLVRKVVAWTVLAVSMGAFAACGGSSGGGGSLGGGDFCTTLKADVATFDKLGSSNPLDTSQIVTVIQDLTNKAPSEIKGDWQTLLDGYKKSIEVASQIKADPSKSSSLESTFEADSKQFDTASKNIEAHAKSKCGVDLNSGSSSDSFTASDTSDSSSSTDDSSSSS